MERDKLLGTMDAKVWTDEFMATKARLGDEEFDHAMMLAWFANAIMAGFDEANRRAQRALDAERERVKELEEWQRVVVGTGTDQEAVVRMAATEYTKIAVQCWKDENAKLTAQLAALQAQLAEIEQILCIESGKTTVDKVRDLHHSFKQVWNSYQSAVNELFDTQAQLRQVEGENELLKSGQRYMALGKERDTLRQLVEEADELYTHYGLLANPGYTGPINIFEWIGKVRAAKDAGKETDNGV